jgi:hypothetical protein
MEVGKEHSSTFSFSQGFLFFLALSLQVFSSFFSFSFLPRNLTVVDLINIQTYSSMKKRSRAFQVTSRGDVNYKLLQCSGHKVNPICS